MQGLKLKPQCERPFPFVFVYFDFSSVEAWPHTWAFYDSSWVSFLAFQTSSTNHKTSKQNIVKLKVKMIIFRIFCWKWVTQQDPGDTFGAKLAPQVLAAHRSPCAVLFSVHTILYPLSDWPELTPPALWLADCQCQSPLSSSGRGWLLFCCVDMHRDEQADGGMCYVCPENIRTGENSINLYK